MAALGRALDAVGLTVKVCFKRAKTWSEYLLDMFLINHGVEIVACILLQLQQIFITNYESTKQRRLHSQADEMVVTELSINFNFLVLHSISHFCTSAIVLIWN